MFKKNIFEYTKSINTKILIKQKTQNQEFYLAKNICRLLESLDLLEVDI